MYEEEEYQCKCGAKTIAKMEYSDFRPMNNDSWRIECYKCGAYIVSVKCNRLESRPSS